MKKSWLWILTAICALGMAAAGTTKSFVPITAFEMVAIFGASGGGGGGDTGTPTDPPPIEQSSQYHWEYYGVGPVSTVPRYGSIPSPVEVSRATISAGNNYYGYYVTLTGCYKAMQRPAYEVLDVYERWKQKVHNSTGAVLPASQYPTGETFNMPRVIPAGQIYGTPC